jgi:hypothetical protein
MAAISMIRIAGFSLDRLVRFHVLLGSDVEIVVKPRARAMAEREACPPRSCPKLVYLFRTPVTRLRRQLLVLVSVARRPVTPR